MSNKGHVEVKGTPDNQAERIIQKYSDGNLHVTDQTLDKTAFGELSTADLSPEVQIQFPYAINTELILVKDNNGTTSVENNMAKLSTGAQANSTAELNTFIPLKYHPGQGALVRFTAIFTTGVSGSTQLAGIGNTADGLFFGYNGTDFGILRKQGGAQEVRTLTVSTGSTTNEDVTITLDGDAKSDVAVTNNASIYTTANEIAAADYSAVGRGWDAHSPGDGTVVFKGYCSLVQNGAYSLTASTAVGSFAQTLAGVLPTDTWINQTGWNIDKANGSDLPSLDQTKGNVYQIRYQWLGFGMVSFYIEHPDDGEFHLVHQIRYANENTIPSLDNPTLPLCLFSQNEANTSDVIVRSSSMGSYTEGMTDGGHVHHGIESIFTAVGTTETPVLTIHNKNIYQGKENRVRIKVIIITASVEGTKPSILRVKLNPTLEGASYTDIDASDSVINYDTSASSISGGDLQITRGFAKSDADDIDLGQNTFFVNPGEFMTLTLEATASTVDGVVSINWEELF